MFNSSLLFLTQTSLEPNFYPQERQHRAVVESRVSHQILAFEDKICHL